jgi:uncharacterized phage protein (TIGR01671 family)
MRPIKFRAWDKIDNLMCVVNDWNPTWVSVPVMDEDGGHLEQRKMDDVVLMEFTGLKDSNGVEIFEGDVVRILYTDWGSQQYAPEELQRLSLDDYKKHLSKIGVVKFYADGRVAEFGLDFGGYSDTIYEGKHGEKEVIGNIYESPELVPIRP